MPCQTNKFVAQSNPFCTSCGAALRSGAAFCGKCGIEVGQGYSNPQPVYKNPRQEAFEEYENDYVGRVIELATEKVEKARAEIEIIKIREPNRKSQKIIPTQATILNAGNQDYYVIFGIDQHITCDELKEQYRKLSVKYNSSIGMLSRTKEENEIIGKVNTRINQAYTELDKAHKCG